MNPKFQSLSLNIIENDTAAVSLPSAFNTIT